MELPNYRLPGVKNVTQLLWEKAKDFLQRAFSVILIATIVVWFLQSFDLHLNLVEDSSTSILAAVSGLLRPLFAPLGLGDWRICTSLISGFMAKESVVSTLEVLFGRKYRYCTFASGSSFPAGIQPALYPVCGSNRFCKTGTWRKMGSRCGGMAVRCCMGGSTDRTSDRSAGRNGNIGVKEK